MIHRDFPAAITPQWRAARPKDPFFEKGGKIQTVEPNASGQIHLISLPQKNMTR